MNTNPPTPVPADNWEEYRNTRKKLRFVNDLLQELPELQDLQASRSRLMHRMLELETAILLDSNYAKNSRAAPHLHMPAMQVND